MKTYKELREMMAAGTGGFTSAADSKGPVAGFDLPFKGMIMRRGREAADRNKRKGKKNK